MARRNLNYSVLKSSLLAAAIIVPSVAIGPARATPIDYDLSGNLENGVAFDFQIQADTSHVQQVVSGGNTFYLVPATNTFLYLNGVPHVEDHIGAIDLTWVDNGAILTFDPPNPPIYDITFNNPDLGSYNLETDLGPIAVTEVQAENPFVGATNLEFSATLVPEPSSLAVMGAALIGLFGWRRRKRA